MGTMEETISVRIPSEMKKKIEKKQAEAKRKTGFEPSLGEVVRVLIERGLEK